MRVYFNNFCQFIEIYYFLIRNIIYMSFFYEGQLVMFRKIEKINIFNQNYFVMIFIKDSIIYNFFKGLIIVRGF